MLAEVLPLADPLTALLDVEADSPVGDEASPVVGVDSPVSVLPVLAESFELGVAVSVFPLVSAAKLSGCGESVAACAARAGMRAMSARWT